MVAFHFAGPPMWKKGVFPIALEGRKLGFNFDLRENISAGFMEELDQEWKQCSREVVGSPTLEVFSQ